MTVTQKSYVG